MIQHDIHIHIHIHIQNVIWQAKKSYIHKANNRANIVERKRAFVVFAKSMIIYYSFSMIMIKFVFDCNLKKIGLINKMSSAYINGCGSEKQDNRWLQMYTHW